MSASITIERRIITTLLATLAGMPLLWLLAYTTVYSLLEDTDRYGYTAQVDADSAITPPAAGA